MDLMGNQGDPHYAAYIQMREVLIQERARVHRDGIALTTKHLASQCREFAKDAGLTPEQTDRYLDDLKGVEETSHTYKEALRLPRKVEWAVGLAMAASIVSALLAALTYFNVVPQ